MKFSGITATSLFALSMVGEASAATVRGGSATTPTVQDVTAPSAKSDRALLTLAPEYDYDAYRNQGCRTHNGGKGVKGHDYELYEHLNKHECEELCNSYGTACKAYETGSQGRCEIWFTNVPRTEHASGNTCYVKRDYYYHNNHNKVCRTAHGGKGVEGKDYIQKKDYDCAGLCDIYGDDCKAYESGPDGHCEIWFYLPKGLASNHGFNCAFKYYH